jgi:hypothetical protein
LAASAEAEMKTSYLVAQFNESISSNRTDKKLELTISPPTKVEGGSFSSSDFQRSELISDMEAQHEPRQSELTNMTNSLYSELNESLLYSATNRSATPSYQRRRAAAAAQVTRSRAELQAVLRALQSIHSVSRWCECSIFSAALVTLHFGLVCYLMFNSNFYIPH